MSSKMLDRVSKVLNQAENAGTPEEAATYMEAAQRLAEQNGIELALARMHQANKERVQVPEERRIQVNPYSRKVNRKHFINLAMVVANVNDVEYLIGGKEYTLHAVGFPTDLDVVEALYTHLAVQMVSDCDKALAAGANRQTQRVPKQVREPIPEDERAWGEWHEMSQSFYNDSPGWPRNERSDPPKFRLVPQRDADGEIVYEDREVAVSDGRAFRHDFYTAFISRMSARLWEAKRQAQKDAGVEVAGSNDTSLAIRDKREEVKKAHEEQRAKVKHLGVYTGSQEGRASDYTGAGREHGRRAAESAPIGTARAVGRETKALG